MENKLVRKTYKIIHKSRKSIYQATISRNVEHSILFIAGCQRSGTSMMLNILERDLNTRVYHEFSELSSNDRGKLRLNPLDLVKKEFGGVRAPFIVAKPLVESQNIPVLLDYFDNSWALWMFRSYKDVAASNIKHFGIDNGIKDIRPIVNNESNNWRSERVSPRVRKTVAGFFSEDMNPYDAAVLFWYARNSLFFDLAMDKNPKIMMCCYEEFVVDPEKYIRSIYHLVRRSFPGAKVTTEVHANSSKKGKDLDLSPQVEQLARELQNRLEAAYRSQPLPA